VPALHRDEQQSAAALQGIVSAMHPHLPVELQNGLAPQQSVFVLHAWPALEHPQLAVAELQSLVQHWVPEVQLVPSPRHGVWHKPSAPQVFPVQQSASCPHGLPSFEQPQVSETPLQTRLQQFA
jgi:hypothetical protein